MKRKTLFSNGTQFMFWQSRNCDVCVKASRYNERTDTYTKYRCAVQRHIEEASVGDGMGNERTWNATHLPICPYRRLKRNKRNKTKKQNPNQTTLKFDEYESKSM